jgi:pilus assembly protein CpaF
MPGINLMQRLAAPRADHLPEAARRPWDDEGVRRVTAAIQQALRRDCPQLLNPTDTSPETQQELMARIQAYLVGDPALHLPGVPAQLLARQVFDYVAGLGPLAPLLERADVSEIMVNRHDDVWIEVEGRLQPVPGVAFRDDTHVFYVAQRVLAPLGIELSAARPLAEGRLPGGVRVAASVPPAGPCPTLSIRKPTRDRLTAEEYLQRGTATPEMLQFLQAVVRGRGNLLIAGPAGAGKTTLLRYLSGLFDPAARIMVLEERAELGLDRFHPHVVALEGRGTTEGRGGVSMADLLQHALCRRPDYIVV